MGVGFYGIYEDRDTKTPLRHFFFGSTSILRELEKNEMMQTQHWHSDNREWLGTLVAGTEFKCQKITQIELFGIWNLMISYYIWFICQQTMGLLIPFLSVQSGQANRSAKLCVCGGGGGGALFFCTDLFWLLASCVHILKEEFHLIFDINPSRH